MKIVRVALPGLALMAMLAGCIPSQRQLAVERDLDEMKRRLAATERSLVAQQNERSGEMQQRLDDFARRQAEQQAGLDSLRMEMQTLGGRFEDLNRDGRELRDELALVRDDLGLKIAALERQGGAPAATAAPTTGIVPPQQPEAFYLQGVDLIRKQGKPMEGRRQLQDFLQKHPGHALAPDAAFWIGESYFVQKQYEQAILQYQDVIQKHGEHPRAASALYKQGLSFDALGDRQSARVLLQKLVDTFPMAEETKQAREKLKTLGR